jgi:hypothetical protein
MARPRCFDFLSSGRFILISLFPAPLPDEDGDGDEGKDKEDAHRHQHGYEFFGV